jgi:integrase/recombinase XerD
VDLGLRTSEVVRLKLDDIDWCAGVVQIRGKGRRIDAMPLPALTGRAIAAYLRNGWRKTADRTLFVRIHPPLDQPVRASTIRAAVRNAARRGGLDSRLTGPHILRHTLATRLVRNGASIKDIADVLRHRSLDTTAIYAKVDLASLATVAMPWPEGQR